MIRYVNGSLADVDQLKPLWLELHQHHQTLLPQQAPYVRDSESWASRQALYLELLAKPDTILILVYDRDALIGYGLAHVMEVNDTWVADTWATGSRIGEIESLGALPTYRGNGIGTAVLERLIDHLHQTGVDDFVLGVVPGNRAISLYERFGFRATWSYMSRFYGRS